MASSVTPEGTDSVDRLLAQLELILSTPAMAAPALLSTNDCPPLTLCHRAAYMAGVISCPVLIFMREPLVMVPDPLSWPPTRIVPDFAEVTESFVELKLRFFKLLEPDSAVEL